MFDPAALVLAEAVEEAELLPVEVVSDPEPVLVVLILSVERVKFEPEPELELETGARVVLAVDELETTFSVGEGTLEVFEVPVTTAGLLVLV